MLELAKGLMTGSSLRSFRLVLAPEKWFRYVSECLILERLFAERGPLEQKTVAEVLRGEETVSVTLGRVRARRSLWLRASYTTDLLNICMACQILSPKIVFEIGTFRGYMAYHMALNTPPETRIYTLDLPGGSAGSLRASFLDKRLVERQYRIKKHHFDGTRVASKVHTLEGDSATFDFSQFHGEVDLFSIDGAHSYEYVRSDTENALKCCRPGGLIIWHDYGRLGVEGVRRCVLEYAKGLQIFQAPGGSVAFCPIRRPHLEFSSGVSGYPSE